MHDLVIKNALIYDGGEAPPRAGSLGVSGGKIAEIGKSVGAGREILDAEGLALAPGFIDTHTHYDAQITWDPLANPSSALGVTTVVMGNCGFTIAPCRPTHRDLILRNLTHVEGMSLDALRSGVQWNFETFPDYLDWLEERGVGLNVAGFIGHTAVRTWVMGDEASQRAASVEEIAEMRRLVVDGVRAGALGFSTTTFEGHNGENGVPMPSLLAEEDELRALVGGLGEAGRGVFMLTSGGKTRIRFLESLAEESGRPVIIAAFLHDPTRADAIFRGLDRIADARTRNHELYAQVSACPLTMEFTLTNPYLMEAYGAWRPVMEADEEALPAVYADPAFRAAMKAELDEAGGLRAFNGEWSRIQVALVADPALADAEGRTVADMAKAENKHPLDWFLDFGLQDNLKTVFNSLLLNSDEDAVARLLKDPNTSVSLSDAGAHLTFFCDAGYGLHLLGHWTREKGLFTVEQAIHQLTARQADIYRMRGRGRLVEGTFADMILFDPATVGRGPNRRVHDLPGGGSRLTCAAEGLYGAWVNGARVADERGAVTAESFDGNLPGRMIRDFAD